MKKIINFLIIILVILLPLVNSYFFDLIWIKFWLYVDWNYEFTKSIFFNLLSAIIIFLFFLKNFNKKIYIPNILLVTSWILILSSFFSSFPLTSLFWENWKWHWTILFLNLIWLSIVFLNQEKKDLKKYLNYSLYSVFFVIFFWIKEYYFPTFDYWNLSNRAIWTFGHPNFLVLYLLILFPLTIKNIKNTLSKNLKTINYFLVFLIIFTSLISQSIWWILLLFCYIIILWLNEYKKKINKAYLFILAFLLAFILLYIVIDFWLITKLNSFISRFYIWKTTLITITDNFKVFLFWHWLDTLSYIFDSAKVPELYIFENFWYTSDRPHNLFLNIFYHIWFLWCIILIYFIFQIYSKYKKNNIENKYLFHSIFLFLLFTIFNFSSISIYLLLIIILSEIFRKNIKDKNIIIFLPFIWIWIIWIIWSLIYFSEEVKTLKNKSYIGEYIYYQKIISENPEKNIFNNYFSYSEICEKLTLLIPSVENYFYCWNSLYEKNKKKSINYYNKWLIKIPDMWDENSKYYNKYFINKIFVPERFYSEKFSNLKEILKRVWK